MPIAHQVIQKNLSSYNHITIYTYYLTRSRTSSHRSRLAPCSISYIAKYCLSIILPTSMYIVYISNMQKVYSKLLSSISLMIAQLQHGTMFNIYYFTSIKYITQHMHNGSKFLTINPCTLYIVLCIQIIACVISQCCVAPILHKPVHQESESRYTTIATHQTDLLFNLNVMSS